MKYYNNTSKFSKAIGSTGFITIIACALIAVGAIAWFALSGKTTVTETPSNTPDSSDQSYNDNNATYNNSEAETPSIIQEETVTDVNDDVSDVPYGSEDETTDNEASEEKITYVLPVDGNISKGYSDSALQYSATYGDMRLHTGIDILCELGTDIKSAGVGTVKSVADDANYGRVITIEHPMGITVKYCGLGSVNVNEGDEVSTGDVIGTSGDIPCECADNPHIHIEVSVDGETASPLSALELE